MNKEILEDIKQDVLDDIKAETQNEMESRIEELEAKAERMYIEYSDWNAVLDMLESDERKEYEKIYKEVYGE
ncbi:MAG: hypothetical protein WC307_06490 [Candidatus Nanoarchaeia archaeon]|jgi:hypothetical protein